MILEMYLQKKNIKFVFQAIENLSLDNNGNLKPGLKVNSKYLLIKLAKILKVIYLIDDKEDCASDIDKYLSLISITDGDVFGDAVYELNKNRNVNLRKPQELPLEDDVKLLRKYLISNINKLTCNKAINNNSFTDLRDLIICRLTIFNARRGGEPCRLKIKDWDDAKKDVWLNDETIKKLDEIEKSIIKKVKITYQTGKGNNHLVPILFPLDVLEGLDILCSSTVRESIDIHKNNEYIFASTHSSLNHVTGVYCFDKVCLSAGVKRKDLLTATKNRHRISTLFAMMDLEPDDRQYIFKHMGHSSFINENVYQSPLVLKELSVVGKGLLKIDESNTSSNNMIESYTEKLDSTIETSIELSEDESDSSNGDIFSLMRASKSREIHKWTHDETLLVLSYFKRYLNGKAEKKLSCIHYIIIQENI